MTGITGKTSAAPMRLGTAKADALVPPAVRGEGIAMRRDALGAKGRGHDVPVVERYSTFMRDVRTYGFSATAASGVATWKMKCSPPGTA